MEHLDEISVEDLQQALDNVEGKKPTQRLLAAIMYKNGVSQTEIAEWYDVERKTIYNWFKRLDAKSLEQAVTDAHRPGRNRKLSEKQQQELERTLQNSPADVGYDALTWTPTLVQQYLAETFDAEYSQSSCRRLMKEAGLSYQKPRRIAVQAETEDCDESDDEFKKSAGRWTPQ